MDSADTPGIKPQGLRERKKAKTRSLIQDHAFRLFRQHGYEATTVEQIAAAAEVSPSTFFRYFPTKEDVVLYDAFDPVLLDAISAQPPEVPPVTAFRRAIRSTVEAMTPEEQARQLERSSFMFSVPDLRGRFLDQAMAGLESVAVVIGRRMGLPPDDIRVRTLVGAVLGVSLVMTFPALAGGKGFPENRIDEALEVLERGLPS